MACDLEEAAGRTGVADLLHSRRSFGRSRVRKVCFQVDGGDGESRLCFLAGDGHCGLLNGTTEGAQEGHHCAAMIASRVVSC